MFILLFLFHQFDDLNLIHLSYTVFPQLLNHHILQQLSSNHKSINPKLWRQMDDIKTCKVYSELNSYIVFSHLCHSTKVIYY